MGSAKQDYIRFLRWLHEPQQNAPENVRRFGNMIWADFSAIAETSRQHNARSSHLAQLARRTLSGTSAELPNVAADNAPNEWPWRRLRSLTVGPFRGFRREEQFDLRKRVVLFYGPNGSGKTSLCEALERALVGSVAEAELKRLDERRYLENIHAGRFVEPRLMAIDGNGREVPVAVNANLYRFCFVEKNRIDTFSRLAARPMAQRTELIATLFGMDQFNDFVSHFNEQMDAELKLLPERQDALRLRRESLERDQATVRDEALTLARHDEEDAAYANAYTAGTTYPRLKELVGTAEMSGRLRELQELLNTVPPSVIALTREGLSQAYESVNRLASQLRETTGELERRSSQVSFKALYTAVVALQATEGDHCPACDTPLGRVAVNPYQKAGAGLDQLRDLGELQETQLGQRQFLDDGSRVLRADLGKVLAFLDAQGRGDSAVAEYIRGLPPQPRGTSWWMDVYADNAGVGGVAPSLEQVFAVVDEIAQRDALTKAQLEERDARVHERDSLLRHERHIIERDLRRQLVIDDAAAARQRIEQFEIMNAELIAAADEERRNIERDRPIKVAYDLFLPRLLRFRNQLPGMLIAGLNDLAKELYNEFNHLDRQEDKLAALHLPLAGDQRIEIVFRGAPQRRVDALVVLSEGHIRCLGLAILMAKSISMGCPLVIFDDAINAIDHDHRSGIRQTIFDGDRFVQMQIIVTCHSHEFIKDAQNSMPQGRRGDCQEYLLMHHDGDYHPRVEPDIGSSNYLTRARRALDRFDSRDALSYARKSLEMLSRKGWAWLKSHEMGELTMLIDGPGNEPTLRALCESLRKKLRESPTFAHASKDPLLAGIQTILGIPSNLIWTYLNKGTHEEANREDFDRAQVTLLVNTLEQIDLLELRLGR